MALFALGVALSGLGALLLTAVLLGAGAGAAVLLARAARATRSLPGSDGACAPIGASAGGASRWFLLGTVIDAAALNVDIIFVGLLVAPASAGIYFNAFRTAGLLTLFMFAITLVVAPMVAQHYHAGEMRKAQAITALCAWAGFVFSLVVFAGLRGCSATRCWRCSAARMSEGWLILILLVDRAAVRRGHRPVAHRHDDDRARARLCAHLRHASSWSGMLVSSR